MRKILVALLAVLAFAFVSCGDTKDCVCEIEGMQTTVSDWDGACSDISSNDIPNLGSNPCSEL